MCDDTFSIATSLAIQKRVKVRGIVVYTLLSSVAVCSLQAIQLPYVAFRLPANGSAVLWQVGCAENRARRTVVLSALETEIGPPKCPYAPSCFFRKFSVIPKIDSDFDTRIEVSVFPGADGHARKGAR